jgi:catalase
MISTTASAQNQQTKSTPQEMVDALHSAFGKHPNARAVHAKGLILEGTFTPAADAKRISKAPHLQSTTVRVTFRFSDFTGIPNIPDTVGASNPRGLSIKFHLPDGSSTDIVAHSFNGFPTATTDEFRQLLLAISKSAPDAAHPNAVEQFLATHPIAKTFLTTQKPPSVSYGTLSYFGVNAFKFTNAAGKTHFIRYQFIPEAGEQFLTPEQVKEAGPDYLSKEIAERVAKGPIKFKFYAQVAASGDKIEDPSIAWPDERKLVLLGVFTINKLSANTPVEDQTLTFNPGNLPAGIEIADQMLADRKALYPISVKERQQPKKDAEALNTKN